MKRMRLVAGMVLATGQLLQGCGIVCYIGPELCKEFVVEGLARLEYRGYDSAGFACLDAQNGKIVCLKAVGAIDNLRTKTKQDTHDGHVAISHTRWATHGGATETNAHPHYDTDNKIVLVHNGIMENYMQYKQELINQGCEFRSQTDTEVIVQLFSTKLRELGDLKTAAQVTMSLIKGSAACVIMLHDNPDVLVALRKGAPLCIGVADGAKYIASDFLGFAGKTDNVAFLPNNTFALVTRDAVDLYNAQGESLPVHITKIHVEPSTYQKLGYEHFMLKEIYEQQRAIKNAVTYYKTLRDTMCDQLGLTCEQIQNLESINLFACGTSWHAAYIGKFFFEHLCHIPVNVHIASEYRYMPFLPEDNSLYIAISQSGETADTLECLRMIKEHGKHVACITNAPTSTMVRESNGHLLLQAGREIAVASTKAFSAQLTALYWLAHYVAYEKGLIARQVFLQAEDDLEQAADVLQETLEAYRLPIIEQYAKQYASKQKFMFLGRDISYPFALEAALKLKEISYIFAQGFAAGELKHGSIALVDQDLPVMLFSHLDPVIYKKLLSNLQEVKARKGHVIAVAFEGQDELIKTADVSFVVPKVAPLLGPLAMTGLMQFLVYQMAKELGREIDKPRNLAKAVTVE